MRVYGNIDTILERNPRLDEAATQAKRLISLHQVTFTPDETRPGQHRVNFHTIGNKKVWKSISSNAIPSSKIPEGHRYSHAKFIDALEI